MENFKDLPIREMMANPSVKVASGPRNTARVQPHKVQIKPNKLYI